MKTTRTIALLCAALAGNAASAAQWSIDIETGAAGSGYCDVRVPGTTGDDISFTDDLSAETTAYFRARLGMLLGEKHQFYIELAPLTIESSGTLDAAADFDGITFAAGDPLDASFRFDTYRMLYRYLYRNREDERAGFGVSLLLRDAELIVESATQQGTDDNIGLVPLFGFEYARRVGEKWWFVFDINAAAASQGRAEDLFVGAKYAHSDAFEFNAGYRLIEGGADVDQVYAFAAINHLALGATVRF